MKLSLAVSGRHPLQMCFWFYCSDRVPCYHKSRLYPIVCVRVCVWWNGKFLRCSNPSSIQLSKRATPHLLLIINMPLANM